MKALSVIAGVLVIVAFIPYILAILRKETKPAKASWIIWATLDTITFVGMYAKHTLNGQIIGAVLGVWIIVVLALRFGAPGWTKIDRWCLGGAAVGVVLMTIDPTLAILASSVTLFLGSIPTFQSAWKDPSREDKLAWTIFWVSCVCTVVAIPHWTLADVAQPVTFFVIETIMMGLLFLRKAPKK